jgi:hypothetical protein
MSGVIVVAPVEARWCTRAESALADARLFTARLYEPRLLPLLVRSGGVIAIAIDARAAERAVAALRECAAFGRGVKIVLVHEEGPAVTIDGRRSQPLPDEPAAIVALAASR